MLARWFAAMLTNVSEEMLADFFKAIVREVLLKRKEDSFDKAVWQIDRVLAELATEEGISTDEKNARLIAAGRVAVRQLRS